ncbi:histidinol dehydrogenase [Sphingomonas sp. AX6]|uniref:histidinol dehydrogenase n=1 Tax=Sphingomonas sp. AX6 TaxID=2653171 RepID=UPI0012F1B35C|nr:histidinol dehydrogenase [Sphingomonas sp. AX6]VXC79477.1 bifunctional histidinal dehydrogenase and histidinol dehydrogenase [Sphingomonas sp. AX6]
MIRLSTADGSFERDFRALVEARREPDVDVARDVRMIVSAVRDEGDAAVRAFTQKFDRHDLDATGWRIERADLTAALNGLEPELRAALELARDRIAAYHEKQRPADSDSTDADGIRTGARWNAVDAAGLYVPGGRAAYPSSVLMNAIPAKVAGVSRLVMVTPTPDGEINSLVLAAAELAGVDEVWRVGGAQAIAALAYGSGRIAAVDVICGPGNAWVAEAKRQLYGVVGIDMVAGPSEILVVADGRNDPDWIAADLLSQSEHDPTSQSILITTDAGFADQVAHAVDRMIGTLSTADVARQSWDANGAIIVAGSFDEAPALINALAPEHLELAIDDAEAMFARVRHAGSVFLGRHTPEAVGDYVAGPNHVLPTGRRARFASGLSVLDFMKRTSFLSLDAAGLAKIGPAAVALATAEGLPAHARSVAIRLGD